MNEDRATLTVGYRFSTYQMLRDKISEYEKSNFVQLWKREARTIDAAKKRTVRYLKPHQEYYQLKLCCIRGGRKFKSEGKGIRKNM